MIRTLIADDDALLRAALRTMVDWEALGYTLVWDCTNGLQMLELLQRTTVDLLITDMKMPLLDGPPPPGPSWPRAVTGWRYLRWTTWPGSPTGSGTT